MALPSDCSSTCSSSWSKSPCCDGGSVLRTSRTVIRSRGGCLGGLPHQRSAERGRRTRDNGGLARRRPYPTSPGTTHLRGLLHPGFLRAPPPPLWPCCRTELGGGRR